MQPHKNQHNDILGARVSLFFYVKAYFAVTLFSAFSYHIIKQRQTFSATPAPKTTSQECLNSFVKMRAKVKQKHLSLVGCGGGVPQM